MTAGFLSSM